MPDLTLQGWPADTIEQRDPRKLIPNPRNPRVHPQSQIADIRRSIEEFGFTVPCLIDEADMIWGGHGRREAALFEGALDNRTVHPLERIPVVVARGWTEAQKVAYMLAENRLAENSQWDADLLRDHLRSLSGSFDLSIAGFSGDALAEFLAQPNPGRADPDDAPPATPAPIVRLGDLWVLGEHSIICGDSTDNATVDRLFDGRRPLIMVTDPPYGVNYDPAWRAQAGVGSAGAATGVVLNDDRADWADAWRLFPGDVAYVWHGGLHAGTVERSLQGCGFQIRAQIIWLKARAAMSRGHYHWQHEPAFFAGKPETDDGWRYEAEHEDAAYAVRDGKTARWVGGRKQTTVWDIDHIKNDTGHGTQKPVECMRRPIVNHTRPGALVYEPFSGSGKTIIACEMTGRVCLAVELSPAYVQVAIERWQKFSGKVATLDGRPFDEVAAERRSAS